MRSVDIAGNIIASLLVAAIGAVVMILIGAPGWAVGAVAWLTYHIVLPHGWVKR